MFIRGGRASRRRVYLLGLTLFATCSVAAVEGGPTITVDLDRPPTSVYKNAVTATIPIGSEPGAVGLSILPDEAVDGPGASTVGLDGYIYLDDRRNARIQKFDSSGTFIAVVFKYSDEFSVESLALDANAHLFLSTRAGRKGETWEVGNQKIIARFPTAGTLRTLGDGQVYVVNGDAPPRFTSVKGGRSVIDDPKKFKTAWPWRNGKEIIVLRPSVRFWRLIVPIVRQGRHIEIAITSKDPIKWLDPVLVTPERLFLDVGSHPGHGLIVRVDFRDASATFSAPGEWTPMVGHLDPDGIRYYPVAERDSDGIHVFSILKGTSAPQ